MNNKYILDKELINEWRSIPPCAPSLPVPPDGYDRWHYVGAGFNSDGPLFRPWAYCFQHDRKWEIDWNGEEDWPNGGDKVHYIIAVRDQEARRSLIRLYDVAKKMAHLLGPIDEEVWDALEDAESVLCNEIWELNKKK